MSSLKVFLNFLNQCMCIYADDAKTLQATHSKGSHSV